jgi:hypothetical protein
MKKKYIINTFWLIGCLLVLVFFLFNPIFNILDGFINKTKYNEQYAIINITGFATGEYYSIKNSGKCDQDISKIDSSVHISERDNGYNFEIKCNNNSFQIWAVPKTYGREGRKSFYLNSDNGIIFGNDHNGGKATANDSVIRKAPDEWKEFLNTQK